MIKHSLNYIRGSACLFAIALVLIIGDPIQRLLFVLLPLSGRFSSRIQVSWFRFWANTMLRIPAFFCGVRFRPLPSVPGNSGVLVLMNHQSLLDIPYLGAALNENLPLFVTRRRYAKGIPLISNMLRLYKFPLVDPARFSVSQLKALTETAANAPYPIAIFPEGSRTKNGEIRKFRTAGVNAILSSRPWSVHLLIVDGLWKCATLPDFVRKISQVRPKSVVFGPFSFDPKTDDPEQFMTDMREKMVNGLAGLRQDSKT